MVAGGRDIRLGTAGWHYPDWEGTVYPHPRPPGFNPLRFLAARFDFVEVNTTFYRIPLPRLAEGWIRQVEKMDAFNFWIKLNRAFTHENEMIPLPIASFRAAVAPLEEAGRLAGILAQYPYSFHCSDSNLERVERLRDHFPDWHLAVEFRHRTWNRDRVLQRLQCREMCWVNIDQPRMSRNLPLTNLSTRAGVEYLRLHGRNARHWFAGTGRDARYDYDYSSVELEEIAAAAVTIGRRGKGPVYISANNHYKGQAVRNLQSLKRLLDAMGEPGVETSGKCGITAGSTR